MLLVGCVAWLFAVAELREGDAAAMTGMLLAAAATFGAARWLSSRSGWLAPLAVAGAAAGLAVANLDTLLSRPLGNPLGYSNAIGSLYMLASAAALLVAMRVRSRPLRYLALCGAAAAALVPWMNATTTAALLVCVIPGALLVRSRRGVRYCVGAAAGGMAVVLLASVLLGATYRPGGERTGSIDRMVDATLSERRAELWHDALIMLAANPVTGVGPGRFPAESPTALRDRDTQWPHNEALHFAAEAGVPGLLLVLGLFSWGFARLWWGADDAGAAVAALALGAAGVHSTVDYIMHFPAVTMAVAALVGAGSRLPRPFRSRSVGGVGGVSTADTDPFSSWDWSFLEGPETRPGGRGSPLGSRSASGTRRRPHGPLRAR